MTQPSGAQLVPKRRRNREQANGRDGRRRDVETTGKSRRCDEKPCSGKGLDSSARSGSTPAASTTTSRWPPSWESVAQRAPHRLALLTERAPMPAVNARGPPRQAQTRPPSPPPPRRAPAPPRGRGKSLPPRTERLTLRGSSTARRRDPSPQDACKSAQTFLILRGHLEGSSPSGVTR